MKGQKKETNWSELSHSIGSLLVTNKVVIHGGSLTLVHPSNIWNQYFTVSVARAPFIRGVKGGGNLKSLFPTPINSLLKVAGCDLHYFYPEYIGLCVNVSHKTAFVRQCTPLCLPTIIKCVATITGYRQKFSVYGVA